MNQTENYQLNQWEPSDRVTREDFNADNAKLDAALEELRGAVGNAGGAVFGWYTGDGSSARTIELGFTPAAVLTMRSNGYINNQGQVWGGLSGQGCGLGPEDTGFTVGGAYTNYQGVLYYYLAFK